MGLRRWPVALFALVGCAGPARRRVDLEASTRAQLRPAQPPRGSGSGGAPRTGGAVRLTLASRSERVAEFAEAVLRAVAENDTATLSMLVAPTLDDYAAPMQHDRSVLVSAFAGTVPLVDRGRFSVRAAEPRNRGDRQHTQDAAETIWIVDLPNSLAAPLRNPNGRAAPQRYPSGLVVTWNADGPRVTGIVTSRPE